jgi:FkbM family methyltransferase
MIQGNILMSSIRNAAKAFAILFLGRKVKPRRILAGLASGNRICVSPAQHLSYLLGTAEPHLQKAIRRYVTAGDTVYDIGANLGYVSLSLANRVGPTGRVLAFEPLPANIELFRQNMEINGITNVQLREVAASDSTGHAVIRVAENLSTASLVWHRNNPSATQLEVETVAIDELVEASECGYPKFVKIDVEGAEGAVLQGMSRTIASAKPVLFVECSDAGREKAWHLLQGLSYRCESAMTGKQVIKFEEYRHSDFLWVPTAQV